MYHITYTLNNKTYFLANIEGKEQAESIANQFQQINPSIVVSIKEI